METWKPLFQPSPPSTFTHCNSGRITATIHAPTACPCWSVFLCTRPKEDSPDHPVARGRIGKSLPSLFSASNPPAPNFLLLVVQRTLAGLRSGLGEGRGREAWKEKKKRSKGGGERGRGVKLGRGRGAEKTREKGMQQCKHLGVWPFHRYLLIWWISKGWIIYDFSWEKMWIATYG